MKKVAICISGEPRMYEHTYERLIEYFEGLKPAWDYDIFIHAWNETSTPRNYQDATCTDGHVTRYENEFDIDELRQDLIDKYKPKRILVESKNVLHDLCKYYKVRCPASKIMSSNFLAMSQHISGERAAYLKSNKEIILPSNEIVGEPSDNDYDVVIKTRFDVVLFSERCQFNEITAKICGFDKQRSKERTPTGMSFFPSLTVRDGRLACEFGHFWSNNKQFDMIYNSLFRKLHNSEALDIYTNCHHHTFAAHCLAQGISMREWRRITQPSNNFDPECGRDFIWAMPNVSVGKWPIEVYRKCYIEYAKEHAQRMKLVDDMLENERERDRELEEQRLRELEEHKLNMSLVEQGKLKDVWYNDKTYFVDIDMLKTVESVDIVKLPSNIVVRWDVKSSKWVKCTEIKYSQLFCSTA